MSIIKHNDQPQTKGYYSKIINRKIVSSEIGAQTCTVWDQTIPAGGYIVPHSHDFEETLTILTGRAQITLGNQTHEVTPNTTIFIPSNTIHHLTNPGPEPVRLIALLISANPKVIYPTLPEPVNWNTPSPPTTHHPPSTSLHT